jgi:hypothetical protein
MRFSSKRLVALVSLAFLGTAGAEEPPAPVQVALHYGLLQPIVMHGLNAAIDVRWKRLIFTYSHGAGLDVTPFLPGAERDAGVTVVMPFSTGGGVGLVLYDELYVLLDVKWSSST